MTKMAPMKVKVISLPYIFQVLYVLCFTMPRYQVSVYRTIGPLVYQFSHVFINIHENQNQIVCILDHWVNMLLNVLSINSKLISLNIGLVYKSKNKVDQKNF